MKKRIYTDASIIGGCLDIEFESGSISLFKGFSTGKNIIVVSSPTLVELEKAPKPVQDILKHVPSEFVEVSRVFRGRKRFG